MVELPTGKMSSRDGNVITYYAFRDRLLEIATNLIANRNGAADEKERLAPLAGHLQKNNRRSRAGRFI